MGKSDQRKTQHEIDRSTDSMYQQEGAGIKDTQKRVNELQPRADSERANLLAGYGRMADTGGIDPQYENSIMNMLSRSGGDADALRQFASTGGINADDLAHIYDPTLTEFSKTGGYTDVDKANIRARSNSAIASTYGNLNNDLAMRRLTSGSVGPGWSEAGFKLARQGAQDIGTNTRNTETDIGNAVRSGRMQAADLLSQRGLGVANLRSSNTLQGYRGASDIDLNRGGLNLDLAKAKMAGRQSGLNGMLQTYGTAPAELMANQNLLRGYRSDLMQGQNALLNSRVQASRIPGLGSSVMGALAPIQAIAGMASGGLPGLSGNWWKNIRFGGGSSSGTGYDDNSMDGYDYGG